MQHKTSASSTAVTCCIRENPSGVSPTYGRDAPRPAADAQPPLRKDDCSRTWSHRGSSGNNFGFLSVGIWVSASTYQAFGQGHRCRQWSRRLERLNIKVLAWGSCCRQWSGSFKLRNIKVLVSEAAGAGNGFEDLKVEVSSFRPGAPAAGSSLQDLSVDRPGPAIRCR